MPYRPSQKLNLSLTPRAFWAWAAALTLLRLAVTAFQQGYTWVGGAPLDDELMFRAANAITAGQWLGTYDYLTRSKAMFFPVWLALLHALHLPYLTAGAALWCAAAGLAAADQLNHRGHLVTVVERAERPGGLLMYGIPNMKLPKDVVQRRIDLMTDEGVTFVCGLDASDKATAQRLMKEYDAVLLCCGAGEPRPLGLDTTGVTGVCYGTEYLKSAVERAQFGKEETDIPSAAGLDVVIIGTGDTASDCVATALRQGCRSVTQLVRRPQTDYLDAQGQLPADYAHEEALAVTGRDPRRFGVQVKSLVTGEGGALTGVATTEGDTLPCQLLIGATGFAGCEKGVCDAFGVEAGKTVRTAPGSYATSVEKVFAAGDMRRGQSLVVWAIAEGENAARAIDASLMGYSNL